MDDVGSVRVLVNGGRDDALEDVTLATLDAEPEADVSLLFLSSCAMRSLIDALRGRVTSALGSDSELTSSSVSGDPCVMVEETESDSDGKGIKPCTTTVRRIQSIRTLRLRSILSIN